MISAAVPVAFLGIATPPPRERDPGHSLPLVALVPQWRQDHPNKRPPTRATAISAVGHEPPPALQKKDRGWCLVVASFQSVFLAVRS
jgi:hypothetical protein